MPDPFPTLRDFIESLERDGELARIKTRVSPILEIAEVCDRMSKSPAPHPPAAERDKNPAAKLGGKALLFENVEGSDIPVAINTFGSYWRVNKALGTESLDALAERVQQLVKPEIPATLIEKMKRLPDLLKMASFPPKVVRSGICQEVVLEGDRADLTRLPIIQCWPLDGDLLSGQAFDAAAARETAKTQTGTGRYITLGGIYTRNPNTGDRNIGMYRVQVFGPRLAAMHWHMHHDGARHFRLWKERGEKMPLAIALGGPSVMPYAATAPLPPGIEELLFAGFLNGGGIELVQCRTIDMQVPANSEIVIEGYVDPNETLLEGPFGDHTGFYSLADFYPAFHVTAITHRKNPIYPTTIVGRPPMEDYYLGKATERVFLPLLKMLIPDIVDYALPISGVFHNCAFVKIKKEYPYQARRVMHAIWGAGQMAFTKFIVVVDAHVDVHNEQDVLFHLFANCDPARDTEIVHGPVDILDHASPDLGAGSKIGFDATVKIPGEGRVRTWPKEIEMDQTTKDLVTRKWKEYGL
ncbi:MAG: 4-hydroxy-3-polyprenylbenzoate decarboxylase [Phycisphaerales bacterium]|jgi:4-hydroxy-3-polyprenylbenzoate decarboxylase|nr:4-hydroxy-3-polyprenylbenzoate decarboxylase [Phycisphaerales bacterium]